MSCARRLKSHRSSKLRAQKIALLMGGTLSKTETNAFTVPKCWLCGKSDHVAAGLTVQQSTCLLSITRWALGSKNSTRLRGLWSKVAKTLHEVSTMQKLWGSPEERFQQSFTLSLTRVPRGRFARFTGPRSGPDCTAIAVGARSAPIAHSRPNRGPTQSGPVNCTKLSSPSFVRYSCKAAS